MDKLVVYFARPISAYNTPQDKRDVALLESMGFKVIEITTDEIQQRAKNEGMPMFIELVEKFASHLYFRAFPDGSIGAGVRQEIDAAIKKGIPVFEMPSNLVRRTLDVDETREMLRMCGAR